ncbi:MAG: D-alanyl-D-alanine carboxypeptidase/D-alanyl-D-alanine endopeptidase [Thermodesulfobacteriota bacterium]
MKLVIMDRLGDVRRAWRVIVGPLLALPRLRVALGMSLVLCFSLAGPALSADAPALNQRLKAIIKRHLPPDFTISIQIADLETGKIVAEENPDLALVPASTMKVATTSAALSSLFPDFTFVTEVLADDVRGTSLGNIYLRGGGDPYLVSEQLFALTRQVVDRGVQEVRGAIVVDDSYFQPSPPLDEQQGLTHRSYHAPYGALSLNFNSVKIVVHPARRPGEAALVSIDPTSEYALLKAEVRTVQGKSPANLVVTKKDIERGRELIHVKGTIGTAAPMKTHYVNVSRPALYTGAVFKEFLLRDGVRVAGQVLPGKAPSNAESLVEFNSWPLSIVVYWLNKFSNNFMAEQVAMAMGARVQGPPGTREKGLLVIRDHLLAIGVKESCFTLSEASGLSRANRLSASALVRVLLNSARQFSFNSELIASLGISGVDGTLKEKFADSPLKRRIRAKTGNLRGVNALAGYGLSRKGRTLVFAVIVNSTKNGAGFVDYSEKIIGDILEAQVDLW